MRVLLFITTFLVAIATSPFAWGTEPERPDPIEFRKHLPDAPDGFEWETYRNSAFLKPNGWFQHTLPPDHKSGTVGATAISPEDFSISHPFEHGFTVQIVTGFKEHKLTVAEGGILYLKPIAQAHKDNILKLGHTQEPLGISFIIRYRDAPPGQTPIIVHKYFIANEQSDALYIFTYECSEATWEENWKSFGTPILDKVVVAPLLSAAE